MTGTRPSLIMKTFLRFSFLYLFFYQLSIVLDRSPGVAIGKHEQLRIGVDGDEGLNVVRVHKSHNGIDLRLRLSSGSMIGL